MIYFDNAATGGFKVHAALSAATSVIKFLSANPGRSAHRLSATGAKIVAECREVLANGFNADPSRVIFTKNCTEALNTAIFGLPLSGRVITTVAEHNSVLRPLYKLARDGKITLEILPVKDMISRLKSQNLTDVSAIVTTAVSNVTGESLPIEEIGEIAGRNGLFYIVDGAQGGGHIPLSVKGHNISCLALAGHKGLGGIMGSGALILHDGTDISPFTFGGTGIDTFNVDMPNDLPERLEAGTLNLPAIASLLEGARFTFKNFANFANTLEYYTGRLINGLSEIERVSVYSSKNPAGIVAFKIDGISSDEGADILNAEYDIAVRGGYHCAPLMHKNLGTEKEGLIRASLSVYNSANEIDYFIKAIRKICR
ncbi:MAG: aminotransferase class V-fold PLP-dependent enzyme [Clostridia bacterium]|nr:aminotransferase class V-fold PLP-dependent enzyme [Clostridia bacterium]